MCADEYIPLSGLRDYFNGVITSDRLSGNILLKTDKYSVVFNEMSTLYSVNGRIYPLKDPIIFKDFRMMIPSDAYNTILKLFSDAETSYVVQNGVIDKEDNITEPDDDNGAGSYVYSAKPDKIRINSIIIDPGHGGEDPGAYGFGVNEKDVVLKTGLMVNDRLKNIYKDKKIIMTRSKDIFIPLEKRALIANNALKKYGESLFISIHANANRNQSAYGFETWYIVDKLRRDIVDKASAGNDRDVKNILNSMVNDEIYYESQELARIIQENLEKTIGNVSLNRGIKENVYFVVKESFMPAVLIEIGFVSNKYEANRLTNQSYLNKIVDGIVNGIKEFINGYEKDFSFNN